MDDDGMSGVGSGVRSPGGAPRSAKQKLRIFKGAGATESGRQQERAELPLGAPWQQRQTRILGGVWLALAGSIMLGLMALGAAWVFARPAPVNTGDPLLDAFLQQCVDRGIVLVTNLNYGAEPPMPAEMFAQLERQFADDPRYWQLCYHCDAPRTVSGTAGDSDQYLSETAGVFLDHRYWYLEEARRRGRADATTLSILFDAYVGEWRREASESMPAGNRSRQKLGEQAACIRQLNQTIAKRHRTELNGLVAELVAAAPEEFMAHYSAALAASVLGDYAAVKTNLAAAARAPRCSMLNSEFPINETLRRAESQSLPKDEPLAGYLVERTYFRDFSLNRIPAKDQMKSLVWVAVEHRDGQLLDLLHTAACRQGQAEGSGLIDSLVAAIFAGMIQKAAQQDWRAPLTAEQHSALASLDQERSRLKLEFRRLRPTAGTLTGQGAGRLMELLAAANDTLCGNQRLAALKTNLHAVAREQQAIAGPIRNRWRQLERFDYTDLDWK